MKMLYSTGTLHMCAYNLSSSKGCYRVDIISIYGCGNNDSEWLSNLFEVQVSGRASLTPELEFSVSGREVW